MCTTHMHTKINKNLSIQTITSQFFLFGISYNFNTVTSQNEQKIKQYCNLPKNSIFKKFNNPFIDHIYSSLSVFKCYSKLVFPPITLQKKFVILLPASVPFCKE